MHLLHPQAYMQQQQQILLYHCTTKHIAGHICNYGFVPFDVHKCWWHLLLSTNVISVARNGDAMVMQLWCNCNCNHKLLNNNDDNSLSKLNHSPWGIASLGAWAVITQQSLNNCDSWFKFRAYDMQTFRFLKLEITW